MTWRILTGDCVETMAAMEAASVDAICTDPPYGLEFMGKDWDSFRVDDPGTRRWRGDHVGAQGGASPREPGMHPARGVAFGGGKHPTTSRCAGCGKRDQFRNPHEPCGDGDWRQEVIDPHVAPPTMLAFQEWVRLWALEAKRVLKPGGHLLAFGGTRTYHRLTSGIEDAGFEIRDTISWMYGSGFPKSLNVSLAIDRAAGAERTEVVAHKDSGLDSGSGTTVDFSGSTGRDETGLIPVYAPATPEAERWDGWGTALKPAHEPIVVARKPLAGTVAATVLEHGTGALNIDGCRSGTNGEEVHAPQSDPAKRAGVVGTDLGISGAERERFQQAQRDSIERTNSLGRWPANVVLAHDEDCVLLGSARVRSDSPSVPEPAQGSATGQVYGFQFGEGRTGRMSRGYQDEDGLETVERWACVPGCPVRMLDEQSGEAGGPSRFFYCAKAARMEREAGLDEFRSVFVPTMGDGIGVREHSPDEPNAYSRNPHPTVKPINLMRWLVRLVTPPGGTVLDPFAGSGSTGCAAVLEGLDFVGIELTEEYVPIAEARIRFWSEHPEGVPVEAALSSVRKRRAVRDTGQLSLGD